MKSKSNYKEKFKGVSMEQFKYHKNTISLNYLVQWLVVIMLFFVGLLNSNRYIIFMGYHSVYRFILILFYGFLTIVTFYFLLNILSKKKNNVCFFFKYLTLLILALVLNFTILFVQNPLFFLINNEQADLFIHMMINIVLIIVIASSITEVKFVFLSIWSLALGLLSSAIIPLFKYPELIGNRISMVDGFTFNGGFWNSAVIAFLAIGWLLIANIKYEKLKIKKIILIIIFVLISIAGLVGLSRALLLSIVLSIIMYLVLNKGLMNKIWVLVFSGFGLISFVSIFGEVFDKFRDRIDTGTSIFKESRFSIWTEYLKKIPDYLIFGDLADYNRVTTVIGYAPHSVLLNWLNYFGILGLFGFLMLIIGVLKSIKHVEKLYTRSISSTLYAWLVAYLTVSLFNETGFDERAIFCSIGIIYAWGLNSYKQNRKFKSTV